MQQQEFIIETKDRKQFFAGYIKSGSLYRSGHYYVTCKGMAGNLALPLQMTGVTEMNLMDKVRSYAKENNLTLKWVAAFPEDN